MVRSSFVWMTSGIVFAALTGTVPRAQVADEPAAAAFRYGALAWTPSLAVTSAGVDSNVFNDEENPRSDRTATFEPGVEAWLRVGRALFSVDNQSALVQYKQFSSQGGFNTTNSARVDVLLNRVTPHIGYEYLNTKERANLEVDIRARRKQTAATFGLDVALGNKTSIDVSAAQYSVSFAQDAVFLGSALRSALNRGGWRYTAALDYQATPLTTFSVVGEAERAQFDFSPERDGDSIRITTAIEFEPLALLRGRAEFGLLSYQPSGPGTPSFVGPVAQVDLGYILRGVTLVNVVVRRDLTYSIEDVSTYFIQTGLTVSFTQQITERWQARGLAGRQRLDLRQLAGSLQATPDPAVTPVRGDDKVDTLGVGLAYLFSGGLRVEFSGDYARRVSDRPGGSYNRLLAFGSVIYDFQ